MNSSPSEQPPPRAKRAPRRTVALIVGVVALVGLGAVWVSRGTPSPASQPATQSSSVAAPTAVPTLDFFRGRSYPTPTAQGAP